MAESCPPGPLNPEHVEDLYPANSAPGVRICKSSAICSFAETPLGMTGVIREILSQHFADANNVIHDKLRRFIAREGVTRHNPERDDGLHNAVYIEPVDAFLPEEMGSRPAVIIKPNDWDWHRLTIGNQVGQDAATGRKIFSGQWYGSHTLFAVCNDGAQAQLLGAEIAKVLLWAGEAIVEAFRLYRFAVGKLGGIAALKESTENYVVPVSIAYVTEESWATVQDAPRIKHFTIRRSALGLT